MSYIEKEKLIKADIASIENRVRHAFNQGYDLGFKNGKNKQSNYSEISKNSPTETLISLDVYKQVAKERDIAIQQLHELGYEFGQKIEPTTKNDLAVDCIDRQATLNAIIKRLGIKNETYLLEAERVIYQQILAMPSVTPQEPRWIPVSERLPEDSGEYLVSVIDKEDEEYKQVGVTWFAHPKDYDIKDGEWRELMSYEKVIAWMPLPKAYREVEE